MILYRKNFVTRGEIWFDASERAAGADVVEYYHVPEPVPDCRCEDFYTLLFDLSATEESLFSAVRPEARRQIRRCMESGELGYDAWFPAGTEPLERFFTAYDELAAQKKLAALDRDLVRAYASAGVLDISLARKADGTPLSWHVNYRTPSRVRQLHSVAFFREDKAERNLVGRAHRWHTWEDIKRCRTAGVPIFDLGGWYQGQADSELLKVNAFKEEFGGTVARHFICERGATLKGKLYLAVRNATGEGMFNAVARNKT